MIRNALRLAGGLFLLVASVSQADITVPGANGSDGPFVFAPDGGTGNTMTIDLSLAPTAAWDGASPSPGQGKGVYDADKWAVVFRYDGDVTIPAGKTVTFKNHPSGAPVVWLVNGNVTVTGTLSLDGKINTGSGAPSLPGPGGFRGGRSYFGGSGAGTGFGPGGGYAYDTYGGSGGSFATDGGSNWAGAVYGNARCIPLIGGSGGAGAVYYGGGGGAGGGAILIAGPSTIAVSGSIVANGGDSYGNRGAGGSGGAIRLVANTVTGSGALQAAGGRGNNEHGGDGRIRIETNSTVFPGPTTGQFSGVTGITAALLWPEAAAPRIRAMLLGGEPVPADPTPLGIAQDILLSNTGAVTLRIEAENVPSDWLVFARIVPLAGESQIVNAEFVSAQGSMSIWEAPVELGNGLSSVVVRARKP